MRWPSEREQTVEKARRDDALSPAERTEAFVGLLMMLEDLLRTSPVRERQEALFRREEEEERRAWKELIARTHVPGRGRRNAGTG